MSIPPAEPFQVYALRLASVKRPARDNFLRPGAREGAMRLDFTMWLVRNSEQAVAVDTGFSAYSGAKRQRELQERPAEAVTRLGVDPGRVGRVVLTHLHFDHAGNLGDFPAAQIVLQAREIAYATGRDMTHPWLNHFFEVEDVADVVRRVHAGQVSLVEGRHELAPGLEVHLVGGHTRGLQVVRVFTERGWVVLASDAAHYYQNLAERNPFPALVDVAAMLDGYDTIRSLADSGDHIVPGHDPEVFRRYPGPGDGIAALHRAPQLPAEIA